MTTCRALLAMLIVLIGAPARAADTAHAQAALPTEDMVVVTRDGQRHLFHVEMALTPDQQEVGLMFRTTVAADGGMLFDWGRTQPSYMWMKNTVAPLDMLFVEQDGTVGHIAERTEPYSLAIIDGTVPVRATVELAAGTAERLDIHVGDHVEQRIFGGAK